MKFTNLSGHEFSLKARVKTVGQHPNSKQNVDLQDLAWLPGFLFLPFLTQQATHKASAPFKEVHAANEI